jgi:hypothetical protein
VERHGHAEARLTHRRFLLVLIVILAGCGGSSSPRDDVAASCKRQRTALESVGPVESLAQATRALRRTIALEADALDDLRPAEKDDGVPALRARLRLALADARRFQASIANVDPTQSMTPLQIGPSGARRAVDRATRLAGATCRLAASL